GTDRRARRGAGSPNRHPSRGRGHRRDLSREGRCRVASLTGARLKVRSRTGGAAVALDEVDRRLLNLLQGSFPLSVRPFAGVGEAAGISEDEVLARTQRLIDERIIRQVTPIFD